MQHGGAAPDVLTGGYVCGFSNIGACVYDFFFTAIVAPAAFILGISGEFLNTVINTTIKGFSGFVESGGGGGAISLAWGLIRDAINMVFIFLLLYIGIGTILGLEKVSYQKMIPKIIFAGLLINFSFFFTEVLIDVSNVATVELHDAIIQVGDNTKVDIAGVEKDYDGLSGAFMKGLSVALDPTVLSLTERIAGMIMLFVVLCVAAFLFFGIAAMLVARYVILIILLITSPVAVMGGILPQLSSQTDRWWKELTNQLIFAPVFMLFMLIVVLIINNTAFHTAITGSGGGDSFFEKMAGAILGYAIVLGLMMAGLIAAKQFAGSASNKVTDWAQKKASSVMRAPAVLAGVGARESAGRFAGYAGKKYDVAMGKMSQIDTKGAKGFFGKAGAYAGKTVATIATKTRLDEGIRDTFKAAATAKYGTSESRADREKAMLERKRQLGQAVEERKREQAVKQGLKTTEEMLAKNTYDSRSTNDGGVTDDVDNFLKQVGGFTEEKIKDMLAHDLSTLKKKSFAGALNARQLDVINKSDLISDADKNDIRNAHEHGLGARMGSTFDATTKTWSTPTMPREVARFLSGRPSDVAQLPTSILKTPEVARRLSGNTLGQIASAGKMSDTDRAVIRNEIERARPVRVPPGATPALAARINAANTQLLAAQNWLTSPAGMSF